MMRGPSLILYPCFYYSNSLASLPIRALPNAQSFAICSVLNNIYYLLSVLPQGREDNPSGGDEARD